MLEKLKKWLSDVFTEPDNKTICPVRIIAIIGALQYLGLGVAHYVQHHIFDAQNFAVGFGTLLGGIGVALGLKKDTSTPPKQ
jgi:hypothetical protein